MSDSFVKYEPRRGGSSQYKEPYVHFGKHTIYLNSPAKEMIGKDMKRVVMFYDKGLDAIGLCFVKADQAPSSLSLHGDAESSGWGIVARGFFMEFNIDERLEKLKRKAFPIRATTHDFPEYRGSKLYVIELKPESIEKTE